MSQLRAGLPLAPDDADSWVDAPFSIQQLNALLQREIDAAVQSETSLLAFRISHRPFGLLTDDNSQFGELRPELRERLHSVHRGIRAVGSQSGEVIGFAPRLQRRTDGEALLKELTKALAEPVTVDGLRVMLGPRSGGAVLDSETQTVEDLLSATKLAIAETDASQVAAMFHPHQRSRQLRTAAMAMALHEAVVNRSLSVRYQPDIDLQTGRLVAIKAYAYWHPDGEGIVLNNDLFDAAKTASLLVPIGREVIEEALRSVYGWITSGLLDQATVWVNVHPNEVLAPDFGKAMATVATFDERLRLGLELTENPTDDQAYIYNVLRTLVDKGATTAIGGFGIGYLNLADFQNLPFSAAKIDRALTKQIASNDASAQLVKAVIGLAELFGLEVTAHGIETIEQAHRLREIGCRTGQGFYFARPMSAEEMKEQLTQIKMGNQRFV